MSRLREKTTATLLIAIFMISIFAAVMTVSAASTYYVATTGSDSGAGTELEPWLTISYAVSKASDGDTIIVAAGTYDETIKLKDTTATGISIIGQDKTTTFITGGICFAADYSGLIVQHFTISGNGFLGTETYQATVSNIWPGHRIITDLEFSDCIFDGENYDDGEGGRCGIVIKRLGGVVKFVNNEFKNYPGWATLDVNDGSGGGHLTVTSYTLINNKFLDNGGSCALRGNPDDYTDTVIVTGNTFDGPAGWAALEVNRAENVEIYDNVIRNVEEFRDWGEGQAMQLWHIGEADIYENIIENNYQGIAILNYPEPFDISKIRIHHNSFTDNDQYALSVDDGLIGGPLDAKLNWWGHASGPSGPNGRTNKAGKVIGKGDAVFGDVDWDPWLPQPVGHTPHDPVPPGLD